MVLKLYKLNATPPSRAVLMVINALNISDVEYVDINLFTGDHLTEEFRSKNPQHTIPTLEDDDFVIWDSHAISIYLNTKYAKDDSLYPEDPKQRAVINQRLHFDSGILYPALRGTAEPILFWGEKSYRPENLAKILAGYDFTEKMLNRPWIAGDHLTLADICCVSSISTMNEMLPLDEKLYSKTHAWMKSCSDQDFYKKCNADGIKEFGELLRAKLA